MPLLTFRTNFSGVKVLKDAPTKLFPKPPSVGQPLLKGYEFTSDPGRMELFGLKKYIRYDETRDDGTRYKGWVQKSNYKVAKETDGASTIFGGRAPDVATGVATGVAAAAGTSPPPTIVDVPPVCFTSSHLLF